MAKFILENPTVVPAQVIEEKTFDEGWLSMFHVNAPDINGRISIMAKIKKVRRVNEGEPTEYKETNGEEIDVHIEDFFGTATAEELQVMGMLLAMIKARANI